MKRLHLDWETYSSVNLLKCGLFKYCESPDFEIIIAGYRYNIDGVYTERKVVSLLTGERLPKYVMDDILDRKVIKVAWNAPFEIEASKSFWGIDVQYNQWRCSMARSYMCGMPGALGKAAQVLNVPVLKDSAGKALIKYFTMPCKPSKVNGGRTRNLPHHDPVKWQEFLNYNGDDVMAECGCYDALEFYPISNTEQNYWTLDQIINSRGFKIDRDYINSAIALDQQYRSDLLQEAYIVAGIENANSLKQLKEWLSVELDEEITKLNKNTIPEVLEKAKGKPEVERVINIRKALAKTSVRKYYTMLDWACADDRIRGSIQNNGAGRTGRAAGRGSQPHNFPRGDMRNLSISDPELPIDYAFHKSVIMQRDADLMNLMYDSIPNTLSSMLRPSIIAQEGSVFPISDYSAIEARVLAYLAGEEWRMEVFRKGGDIYRTAVAMMFKIPYHEVTKLQRQEIGKVSELAFGYGGGEGAIRNFDHKKKIPQDQYLPLRDAWREASPAIADKKYGFWRQCEDAAKRCILDGEPVTIRMGIRFEYTRGYMFITLPSGRKLSYAGASVIPGDNWGTQIVYYGMNQTSGKWVQLKTYGGKLVENIVQAFARDILYHGLMCVHKAGFPIVLHVHDEVVPECEPGHSKEINKLFATLPKWAEGLPLNAEGEESKYYKK